MQVNRQGCKIANLWLLNYSLSSWLQIYIYIYGCKITPLRTGLITLLETVQNLVMPWRKTHYSHNNRQPLHSYIYIYIYFIQLMHSFCTTIYFIKLMRSYIFIRLMRIYTMLYFYVFFVFMKYAYIWYLKYDIVCFVFLIYNMVILFSCSII